MHVSQGKVSVLLEKRIQDLRYLNFQTEATLMVVFDWMGKLYKRNDLKIFKRKTLFGG